MSWRTFLGGQDATAVDIAFDLGHIVYGQDNVWRTSYIVRVDKSTAAVQRVFGLPQPSYSAQRLAGGIFLVGTTHEPIGVGSSDPNVHLYGSVDGVNWSEVFAVRHRASSSGYVRLMAQFRYPDDSFPLQVDGQALRVARAYVGP